jgi:5-methylcytosine-specific restriction endonuclease McrA
MDSITESTEVRDEEVDVDFDQILAESERDSVESMGLVDVSGEDEVVRFVQGLTKAEHDELRSRCNVPLGQLTKAMLDDLVSGCEIEVYDRSTDVGYQKAIRKGRRKDKVSKARLGFFGRTALDRYACEFEAVRHTFEYQGPKPRWAVDGCVILREQGKCLVCQERLSDGYVVKMVVPRQLGGRYEEQNCVCVCAECAKCWFPQRLWDRGLGKQDMLQALSVAVMERRAREYKGCKWLTEPARQRLKALAKEVEYREKKVCEKAIEEQLVKSAWAQGHGGR